MHLFSADALQWFGFATGATGSILLALNSRHSGWGFVLFLLSNAFWAAYGLQIGSHGLVLTQICFTCTSALGIHRWLLAPRKRPDTHPSIRNDVMPQPD